MENTKLSELPDHGHYAACCDRMLSIDRFSRRLCGYTCAACVLMLILTWCTIRLSVISVIPNLLGDRAAILPNMVQSLIILAMAGASILSVYRYKLCSVILFLIYAAMFFAGLFSHDIITAYFSFIIGFGGTAFSFKSVSVFFDYKQLEKTEGFPEFSQRLTFQNEHREFVSDYKDRYYSPHSAEMPELDKIEQPPMAENDSLKMDEI